MHVKSVVSAIALSAALALSGPAFAQTVMGDLTISADDLPAVTERCEQLVNASTTESLTADETEGDTEEESTAGSTDATLESVESVNEIADATSTVDLDLITLEMCTEAGLGGAM